MCELCFLPTYSPDVNPIELIVSRLKAHLRAIGARSIEPVMVAIGTRLNAVTDPAATRRGFQSTEPSRRCLVTPIPVSGPEFPEHMFE